MVPPPVAPPYILWLEELFFHFHPVLARSVTALIPHMEQYAEPHGVTLPAWPCKHYGLACCSGRIRSYVGVILNSTG